MSGPVAHVDDDEDNDKDKDKGKDKEGILFNGTDGNKASLHRHNKPQQRKPREIIDEKILPNGDFYVGTCRGVLPEGRGKYLWSDGCMYEGEWSKGKKNGRGKISWPSGATYEGDFMSGSMHGIGTYMDVDGMTYKGDWVMNQNHGFGWKSYSNGDVFEGSWKDGVREGQGKYVWKDGSEYIGDWKGGVMSGKGSLTWSNGDRYNGHWLDGMEHGRGIYAFLDGGVYVGTWSKGLKHGKGIFYPPGSGLSGVLRIPARKMKEDFMDDLSSIEKGNRPRGSTVSDAEQYVRRRSGDWNSENGIERNHSLDRCFSTKLVSESFNSLESMSTTTGDSFNDAQGRDWDQDGGGHHLPIVERQYAQGVLINELVKENPFGASVRCRTRRRQRRHSKELKRQGEVIFKGHRSYDLMLSLQLGIRYTVGKIMRQLNRELSTSDFSPRACIWMSFPKEGSQRTPPHDAVDFKWKDYCPLVFRQLKEMFKIDAADYMLSICGNDALRELSSPGKSGSMFLLSHDDRFIIKTMRKAEVKVLLRMLHNYFNHVSVYENTLITKFFGLHRIRPLGGQKVRFVVMANMLCTDLRIHRRFDLKGSSQGRFIDKEEVDETTTFKDLDLDFVFRLEQLWREFLLMQIECDCKFLESEHIMDYSILLGLHFRAPQFPAFSSSRNQATSSRSRTDQTSPSKEPSGEELAEEDVTPKSLILVAPQRERRNTAQGSQTQGSPLKAVSAEDSEADRLLPGAARLRVQLGVNMPARADRICRRSEGGLLTDVEFAGEVYDVVLYLGIIDILQAYDVGKKLEHAYKSVQYDSFSISAVDPSLYSKRFQNFICQIFPKIE